MYKYTYSNIIFQRFFLKGFKAIWKPLEHYLLVVEYDVGSFIHIHILCNLCNLLLFTCNKI